MSLETLSWCSLNKGHIQQQKDGYLVYIPVLLHQAVLYISRIILICLSTDPWGIPKTQILMWWPRTIENNRLSPNCITCTLKRKSHHFDEIFIAGCTGSCHFDSFQWWKLSQNDDISVSVILLDFTSTCHLNVTVQVVMRPLCWLHTVVSHKSIHYGISISLLWTQNSVMCFEYSWIDGLPNGNQDN